MNTQRREELTQHIFEAIANLFVVPTAGLYRQRGDGEFVPCMSEVVDAVKDLIERERAQTRAEGASSLLEKLRSKAIYGRVEYQNNDRGDLEQWERCPAVPLYVVEDLITQYQVKEKE